MLKIGLNPRALRYAIFVLNVLMIVSPFVSGTGVARILLLLQSYMTKTGMFPLAERMGKFPVKSVYTVPFFLSITANPQKN